MVSDTAFVTILNAYLPCASYEVMTVKFCNHSAWYKFCQLCVHIKMYAKGALLLTFNIIGLAVVLF